MRRFYFRMLGGGNRRCSSMPIHQLKVQPAVLDLYIPTIHSKLEDIERS